MEKFKASYTDVTEWNIKVYQNTTGSRSKKIIVDPTTEEEYFFKGSKELDDGEIRYPTEFWSEIISSKIGQFLGFNVLDYNIGYNSKTKQKIGCLSKSMVSNSSNKLTEGIVYLTGFNPHYNPVIDKSDYTFQFIRDTLLMFRFEKYLPDLISIIVFDAVIGNSDRHQENWGIISDYEETFKAFDKEISNNSNNWFVRIVYGIARVFTEYNKDSNPVPSNRIEKRNLFLLSTIMVGRFSPIYDSGCCLGREMLDSRIAKMLVNPEMQNAYIRKGTSEIHWDDVDGKLNHFELIERLQAIYPIIVNRFINQVLKKFSENSIEAIIFNIDQSLPENLKEHQLSNDRKELMVKLITLRIQKLNALVS